MRLEEHGAECGAERQRDEAGDHCRGRDRHRELTEEQPGDAGDEGGRHEDGAEREGDRDQRPADFVIVRWAASKGDMPSRMLRSTFSTTTIASSTTMPTSSTRPNRARLLS